jgi:exportin-5
MDSHTNGDGAALPEDVPQIIQALEAIHNPRSTNELRQSATSFLEEAKQSPHALAHGFALAVDPARATIVRHFGLSMMAFHLKYVYSGGGEDILRDYVLRLTSSIQESDPPFLRNKFAQIWTEVAKRIWGVGWMDMDEQLVRLWDSESFVHSEFVLVVLETLSDDIFNQDDYVAGLRQDLGTNLSRVFLTEDVIELSAKSEEDLSLRWGNEGWMLRLVRFLKMCLDRKNERQIIHSCALRTLAVLNSVCTWIIPKSLVSSSCVEGLSYSLVTGDTQIRVVSRSSLFALFLTDIGGG